jgi:predicted PurR-regulated permease PerM
VRPGAAADATPTRAVPGWIDRAAALSWRFLLVFATVVVLGIVFMRLSIVFVPIIVALLIAVVLMPADRRLRRAGLPRTAAAIIVYLGALVVVVGVIALLAPRFVAEFRDLDTAVSDAIAAIRDWLVEGPIGLSPDNVDQAVDQLLGGVQRNTSWLRSGAGIALQVLAGALVALVLGFFFLKDGDTMWGWFLRMLPRRHRDNVDAAAKRAWLVLRAFIHGAAIQGAIEAGVIGLALLIIGVPLVLPIMVLTFVAAFFPLIGAIVAGTVAVLVALVSVSFVDALIVLAVVIVVQQLESNVLAPLVLGKAVRLHPVVVLIALVAGATLGGIIGAFVAVPLTAIAWGIVKELARRDVIEPPGDREPLLGDETVEATASHSTPHAATEASESVGEEPRHRDGADAA